MKLIDTVQVDARTVNDVKVSEDGRTCIISREGASNRRNGFVLLDVSDPHNVEILSTFDDGLTGGVHNVFIHEDHVYAVNNGRRWDVVNVEDPRNPFRVSRFETQTPGRSVHDVWVRGRDRLSGGTLGRAHRRRRWRRRHGRFSDEPGRDGKIPANHRMEPCRVAVRE